MYYNGTIEQSERNYLDIN